MGKPVSRDKVKRYFENLSKNVPANERLDASISAEELQIYFLKKTIILKTVIKNFLKESGFYFSTLEYGGSIDDDEFDSNMANQDIEIYEEMLSDTYDPESNLSYENLIRLYLHLAALLTLYKEIKPSRIAVSTMLKFDLAALRVTMLLTSVTFSTKPFLKEWNRLQNVRRGKKQQGAETLNKIIRVYELISPSWIVDDEKKPILLDGERISVEKLGEKIRDRMRDEGFRDVPTQRWVVTCIKKLKNDDFI